MEIIVLSKNVAKTFRCDQPFAVISIATRPIDFIELHTENAVGVLQLAFLDTPHLVENCFSKEQAQAILDFVDWCGDRIEVLMIHCEAGISRSPGVAAAIAHIKGGPGSEQRFFEGDFWPNHLVYRTILEEKYGKGVPLRAQREAEVHEGDWILGFSNPVDLI